jgi:hypothetical protein
VAFSDDKTGAAGIFCPLEKEFVQQHHLLLVTKIGLLLGLSRVKLFEL